MQNICILGATGSIGRQTLDVISKMSNQFKVFALCAHRSIDLLLKQCLAFNPRFVHLADTNVANQFKEKLLSHSLQTEVLTGDQSLLDLVQHQQVDKVMAAMSGAKGLFPVISALKANKIVLLANKEPIVMAGKWICEVLAQGQGKIIPVDSEHNSIYQVLGDYNIATPIPNLHKIILTASGGPFWRLQPHELHHITVHDALAHPTWSMGAKISIDSATLVNKALELIEAKWLFALQADQLDVLIHPQSIVHSFVVYQDGAQLAQLGVPDMRLSIAYCLAPERKHSVVEHLDLTQQKLEFFEANPQRYPALQLAYDALQESCELACVLNAANEVAVSLFLQEKIQFSKILPLIANAMSHFSSSTCNTIDDIVNLDHQVRQYVACQTT